MTRSAATPQAMMSDRHCDGLKLLGMLSSLDLNELVVVHGACGSLHREWRSKRSKRNKRGKRGNPLPSESAYRAYRSERVVANGLHDSLPIQHGICCSVSMRCVKPTRCTDTYYES